MPFAHDACSQSCESHLSRLPLTSSRSRLDASLSLDAISSLALCELLLPLSSPLSTRKLSCQSPPSLILTAQSLASLSRAHFSPYSPSIPPSLVSNFLHRNLLIPVAGLSYGHVSTQPFEKQLLGWKSHLKGGRSTLVKKHSLQFSYPFHVFLSFPCPVVQRLEKRTNTIFIDTLVVLQGVEKKKITLVFGPTRK